MSKSGKPDVTCSPIALYYVSGWCSPEAFVRKMLEVEVKGRRGKLWLERMNAWEFYLEKGNYKCAMWEAEAAYLIARGVQNDQFP